ncbi:hypothetical protein [Blastococcus xanthinilyticus]|uniref:Uncharacterized protein n=1 Tax=Blastococcus xanthinilyticus TaxID=1564164 RepID=A0A5S5CWI1_9ACTN|nr:hypothetical protein [Blastococcus xanthinilyticus]TYP87196.1 hypothetical protein BD833_107136 [Blastococcus xanthinilyticus]
MSWVLILLTVWVLVAVVAAVVIGRSVCFAEAEAEAARAGHGAPDAREQRDGAAGFAPPVATGHRGGVPPSAARPAAGDAARHARPARRRPTFRGCIAATGRAAMHRGRGAV